LDLSTFLVVLSGQNKKNGFYFSDKRSIASKTKDLFVETLKIRTIGQNQKP
jgi:hypothetical protein